MRLDAEYYQPEYLVTRERISSLPAVTLGEISTKFKKGIFDIKADTYTEEGVPFIRISNLKNGFINEQDMVFISEETNQKEKNTQLLKDDLVLSKTAYPAASLITLPKINISQDIIGISIDKVWKEKLLPVYINIFLNSKFGLSEMEQWFQGNIQMHLALPDAKTILIPIIPMNKQKEVAELFGSSEQELLNSKELYQQAENLLLEKLGIADFKPREDLSFIVNLSEVQEAIRADSNFFQPKHNDIIQRLQKGALSTLSEHFEILKSKNFEYNNEGEVGVIKTKQLGKQFINFEAEDRTRKEIVEKEKLPVLKDSDVVFASMGVGSLGKTNILYDFEIDNGKYTVDSTLRIFRFKNPSFLPEILTIFLASRIGQDLIYKYVVGTSGIISIYEDYLKNFPVPILPYSTQTKIADLVKRSHEARKKSKGLLEEAKRKVEEMIEKGGES